MLNLELIGPKYTCTHDACNVCLRNIEKEMWKLRLVWLHFKVVKSTLVLLLSEQRVVTVFSVHTAVQ